MAGSSARLTHESLGINLPSQVGGTLGQRLVNTNRSQLALPAGLLVNDEQGVDIFLAVNVFDTFDSDLPASTPTATTLTLASCFHSA